MENVNNEALELLREIRDLLIPISACFEQQYAETQRQRLGERFEELEALLTSTRRDIFPLLFDPRRLSQVQIARMVGTTQPTVSRFISMLLDQELIKEAVDETGATIYVDRYNLRRLVEKGNEHETERRY